MLNTFFALLICQSQAQGPDAPGSSGSAPPLVASELMKAADRGDLKRVKELVEKMDRPLAEKRITPQESIPFWPSENRTENGERRRDPIDAFDPVYNLTAIDLALRNGHFPIVRYLIEQGSLPHWLSELHPLHRAIIFEDPKEIEKHLPFRSKAVNGIWPGLGQRIDILQIAAMSGNSEILNLILAKNPDSNSYFNFQQALQTAVKLGHKDATVLLVSKIPFLREEDLSGVKSLAKDLSDQSILNFLNSVQPKIFRMPSGNPWRNLSGPFVPMFSPKTEWATSLQEPQNEMRASVLEFANGILYSSDTQLQFYSQSGERKWAKQKAANSHFFIANDLLYFASPSLLLNSIDSNGKEQLQDSPLPVLPSRDWTLFLLAPFQDGYVSSSFGISRSVEDRPNGVTKDIENPTIIWRTGNFGKLFGPSSNGSDFELHQTASPLYLSYLETVYFLTNELMAWVNVAKKNEGPIPVEKNKDKQPPSKISSARPQPTQLLRLTPWFDETVNWSHDNSDRLCIVGYKGNQTVVAAFDSLNKEIWKWSSDKKDHSARPQQPPIHSIGGITYVLFSEKLVKLNGSRFEWAYSANEKRFSFVVENGDHTLLLTRGNELIHLSPLGKALSTYTAEEEITGPPLVTSAGAVLVPTKTKLLKLKKKS